MADPDKSSIALDHVRQGIATALAQSGRASDACDLLAVSKTFPATAIRSLYAHGQRAFGENYVQELVDKAAELADLPDLAWHFIGPLQSNKTRQVAAIADWVHSVDRAKIAERLAEQRPSELAPLNVCIQVNVSGEASKSGCAPTEALALAQLLLQLAPRLRLRGLMCIPDPAAAPVALRAQFAALRQLLDDLNRAGMVLDTLSMGMSADLALAIAEGATMVRVGSAIFGARKPTVAPGEAP